MLLAEHATQGSCQHCLHTSDRIGDDKRGFFDNLGYELQDLFSPFIKAIQAVLRL